MADQIPAPSSLQYSIKRLKEKQIGIGAGLNFIILPASIAALIIGSPRFYNWDLSPCNTEEISYIVNPITFLIVAGASQVFIAVLYMFLLCQGDIGDSSYHFSGFTSILSIFYVVWSIIGLYMFTYQFKGECMKEAVAIMVFCWSAIDITLRFIFLVGMGCYVCMAACNDYMDPRQYQRNRKESTPLLEEV